VGQHRYHHTAGIEDGFASQNDKVANDIVIPDNESKLPNAAPNSQKIILSEKKNLVAGEDLKRNLSLKTIVKSGETRVKVGGQGAQASINY
jgi:hypothetical protein